MRAAAVVEVLVEAGVFEVRQGGMERSRRTPWHTGDVIEG